ncbi:hypothetical protein tb265_14980 [Gemmatimonadetes bacterium T265]|nr:hypothetical protein tb265_14980 [Gemmatimonadetes bacterium T265]
MQPTSHRRPPARPPRPSAALPAFFAALTLAASACRDATTAPVASANAAGPSAALGLANNAAADTLAVGGTVQLTAALLATDHAAPAWTSSNAAVATVSRTGLVTAVGAGSATVTAANSSAARSVAVVVRATRAAATGTAAQVLAFMAASNVPTVAALQARGGVYARYESDFVKYADSHWAGDSTSFDANFYDRAMIYYVWWARTGNATYLDRANKLALNARTYLENTNYTPPSYNMMIDGVALHALVTGDQRSATTVAKVADVMGNPNGWWAYVAGHLHDQDGDSRHSARVLSAVLDAYLLKVTSPRGYDYAAILPPLMARILTTQGRYGAFRWPGQCNYNKPFMSGMVDDALIRYHVSFQADARIVDAVKRSVDFMWTHDWVASKPGFRYLDADCSNTNSGGTGLPVSDLNNLISSGYAFVAQQTGDASYYAKGDAAFASGVYGAWITGSKQFNQEYTASYRFLSLRF